MSLNAKQLQWAIPIWTALSKLFDNKFYVVAGFMGNLQAESGLCPYRLQGDFDYANPSNPDYPYPNSLSYSQRLSKTLKGETVEEPITAYDFVHRGPGGGGFGLAQWTWWSRKQRYIDFYEQGGGSQTFPCLYNEDIGSIQNGANFLCYELETFYSDFVKKLKSCSSIKEVSDIVVHEYENPKDKSEEVETERFELGLEIYEYFTINLPQLMRDDLTKVIFNDGKLVNEDNEDIHHPLLVKYSDDFTIDTDDKGLNNFNEMVKNSSNITTNKDAIELEYFGRDFLPNSLFFVDGIMMPFSCPISESYKDNKIVDVVFDWAKVLCENLMGAKFKSFFER